MLLAIRVHFGAALRAELRQRRGLVSALLAAVQGQDQVGSVIGAGDPPVAVASDQEKPDGARPLVELPREGHLALLASSSRVEKALSDRSVAKLAQLFEDSLVKVSEFPK